MGAERAQQNRVVAQSPIPAGIVHYTHLEVAGLLWRHRAAAVRDRRLIPVHHGWYADAETWRAAFPEGRHRHRVLAASRVMRGDTGVFSHESAAVLWGLPLYRHEPDRVQTTLRGGVQVRSSPGVFRHRDHLADEDIVHHDGLTFTALARTVVDVARITRTETAIAAADAALRLVAWREATRDYDEGAAEAFRHELTRRAARMSGRRGIRQARWTIDHADGRAQLPGESVSRLQLVRLGFSAIRLQVPIRAGGRDYAVDFGLDEVPAWAEFDGESKYVDPEMTGGRTALEVLRAEKEREDAIRAATGRPIARWGFDDIRSAAALASRLARYGIRSPH